LGVFGQLQCLGRTIPDDGGQPFAERSVDLVEYRPRHWESLGERLAHPNRLGTLPRKSECCRHRRSPNVPKIDKVWPKDTARHGDVKPPGRFRAKQPVVAAAFPCHGAQNPYKARHPWIPGRELNGRSQQSHLEFQAKLMWQGQSARRPVFPPSELDFRVLSEGLEGLDAGSRANTIGKDHHASL
jgi:hypothetical protein